MHGSRNVESGHIAITNLIKTLKSIGCERIDLKSEIHVQNIVASVDLETQLNLNSIVVAFGIENIEYEPEIFPGLVYRIEVPKLVVFIFSSGELVIAGGKTPEDFVEDVRIIRTQFDNFGLLY